MKIETLMSIYGYLSGEVQRTRRSLEIVEAIKNSTLPDEVGFPHECLGDETYCETKEKYQAALDAFNNFRDKDWN